MADRLNITDPSGNHSRWRDYEELEILRLKLAIRDKRIIDVEADLDSIFRRIDQQEPVELHYADGRVFNLTGSSRQRYVLTEAGIQLKLLHEQAAAKPDEENGY